MNRNIKHHFWIIKDSLGFYLPWTIRTHQKETIKVFEKRNLKPWRFYFRKGYQCKKVTIMRDWIVPEQYALKSEYTTVEYE